MELVKQIVDGLLGIFVILTSYIVALGVIGFLFPSKKFKKTDKQHNFAVLIAARNEEKVIAQLIESLKKQDYPSNKITVFVVAHNCTDGTAEAARATGVNVFEYNNPKEKRKGYAIKHGLNRIKEDYPEGVYKFDGYFIFDADNLLTENFVTEMNKAFANKKYDFYTSYINSKNTDMGLVASFRSINYFTSNCTIQRPRGLLGMTVFLSGTGVLIRNYIFHDGWKWNGLTEDTELSAFSAAKGYRGTFVEAAQFYNENPVSFKLVARQQMRWTKGIFVTFLKTFIPNLLGIIWPHDWAKNKKNKEQVAAERKKIGVPEKILLGIQKRLSCYDAIMQTAPIFILSFTMGVLYPIFAGLVAVITNNIPLVKAMGLQVLYFYAASYISQLLMYTFATIREHKNIRANKKYFLYIFIWPVISQILSYVSFISIFFPIKWKPITRADTRRIENMYEIKTLSELITTKKTPARTPEHEPIDIEPEQLKELQLAEITTKPRKKKPKTNP